jgi:hypothetical protein
LAGGQQVHTYARTLKGKRGEFRRWFNGFQQTICSCVERSEGTAIRCHSVDICATKLLLLDVVVAVVVLLWLCKFAEGNEPFTGIMGMPRMGEFTLKQRIFWIVLPAADGG